MISDRTKEAGREPAIYLRTKEEIYTYVKEQTRKSELERLKLLTASEISRTLNISRNLASQYLNELVKSGELIKIASRPVYFLHKTTLENLYGVHLQDNLFQSEEELKKELSRGRVFGKGFEKVIGREESLHFCIEQIVSALSYPPAGLPVLIAGERGSGKRYLSKIAYEYGLEQNILRGSGRFIEIHCPEYAENRQSFEELLLGNEEQEGILFQAKGGMLYFNEIASLPEELVGQLIKLEERREYYDRKNKVKRKFGGRMVFSTSSPVEKMNGRNLQRIPVIISLPSLEERSAYEKEQLIVFFLHNEETRTGKEILLSSQIISLLMESQYSGNVEELQQVIRGSCARAYMDAGAGRNSITLLLHHMPARLVTDVYRSWNRSNGNHLVKLSSMELHGSWEVLRQLFMDLLDRMEKLLKHEMDARQLICESLELWERCKRQGIARPLFFNGRVKVQLQILEKLCAGCQNPYEMEISEEALGIFGLLLSEQSYMGSKLMSWMQENREALERMEEEYERHMYYEKTAYVWLEQEMNREFQIPLSQLLKLTILLELYANTYFHFQKRLCIMAAHGEGTARRMAGYVNEVCGQRLIFPLYVDKAADDGTIFRQVEEIVYSMKSEQELLLLFDLDMKDGLEERFAALAFKGAFGTADQIGMRQLLTAGWELEKGSKVEAILEQLTREGRRRSLYLESRKRPPAILFTSEMGVNTADKFAEMFARCLPEQCEIELLTCDYLRMTDVKQARDLFGTHDIICVVGMMPARTENIPFISIENLISMEEGYRIKEILEPYLTAGQIEALIQGIIRDFTLQNVTRYLTILNPDKTLEYVHSALKKYQVLAGVFLSPRVVVGLSVHMCCMIERLVTKTPFEDHLDYQKFVESEQVFIERMRISMEELCAFYHVEIPLGELAYIHDYIKNDRNGEDFYA